MKTEYQFIAGVQDELMEIALYYNSLTKEKREELFKFHQEIENKIFTLLEESSKLKINHLGEIQK